MSDLRQAAQQALEALENNLQVMKTDWDQIDQEWGPSEGGLQAAIDGTLTGYEYFQETITAITAIRTALEQQAKPVGEVIDERGEVDYISYVPPVGTALYNTPHQRQWVGLTDEEKNNG